MRSPNRQHDRKYFYKYVTADVAKTVLATRKLRWSSPVLFNDPFDVTQELRLDFDAHALNSALTKAIVSLIESGEPTQVGQPVLASLLRAIETAKPDVRAAIARGVLGGAGRPTPQAVQSMELLKEVWRQFVPTFRVLCLSEAVDVTSMWLHYAEQYRGAVLCFEAVDEIDSCFLMARPVVYQDSAPAIADVQTWVRCMLRQTELEYHELFTQYQYVKTTDWAYEREWRIVSGKRAGEAGLFSDYLFHPRELVAIYFGPQCTRDTKGAILPLLSPELEHVRIFEGAAATGGATRFSFREVDWRDACGSTSG